MASLHRRAALGAGLASLMPAPPPAHLFAATASAAASMASATAPVASPDAVAAADGGAARATPNPVLAAIDLAQRADRAFTVALVGLDEDDKVALGLADILADASTDAMHALAATAPTTMAGLHALIRHYAEDTLVQDRWSVGAVALAHLARAIEVRPPPPD